MTKKLFMNNASEKQTEIEAKLIGNWENRQTGYLWNFRNEDGQTHLMIIDDGKPTPTSWFIPLSVKFVDDEKIFLVLWFSSGITHHEIKFKSAQLEIKNPPVDNAANDQSDLITLSSIK